MEENLKLKIDYEELVNLIKKTQKGDTKAKDKLYSLLIDEMKVIANKYLSKYHYLSNDESEYNFLVFQATAMAIDNFKESNGNFYHYWRKCISNHKCKFLDKKYKTRQVYLNDEKLDYYLFDNSKELTFSDVQSCMEQEKETKQNEYYKELYERVLKISDISSNDKEILKMYSLSYTLDEIAKALNLKQNQVISRFYYLTKIIKDRINKDDYI